MDVLWVVVATHPLRLTCLASFKMIDEHYTYIIESDVPASAGNDRNNEDDKQREAANADE
eukprot:scaffold9515_cov136-Skeletonema_dohrnii-CCMP3373.AAC.6